MNGFVFVAEHSDCVGNNRNDAEQWGLWRSQISTPGYSLSKFGAKRGTVRTAFHIKVVGHQWNVMESAT